MLASHTLLLFGDAAPSPAFAGNYYLATLALVAAVAVIIQAMAAARRQPPIGEQMHQEFATKAELAVARNESAGSVRRIHERIEMLITEMNRTNQDAERARGNLFSKAETIEKDVRELRAWLHETLVTRKGEK